MVNTFQEADDLIFRSWMQKGRLLKGYDRDTRDLDVMRRFFEQANVPTQLAPTVTITGSKGKGSTAIWASAILQGMGHRVGLVTSPSFLSNRERIRVDGHAISEDDFIRLVNELASLIKEMDANLPSSKYHSPTGIFLAMAMCYFQEQGVTAVVLEAGRGGRFDEVRLVDNRVACFTPIMDEHLDKLGPTIKDIAWQKTGIIQYRNNVITAPQPEEILVTIQKMCSAKDAQLDVFGKDTQYEVIRENGQQMVTIEYHDYAMRFLPDEGSVHERWRFQLNTPAVFQSLNFALAFASAIKISYPHGHQHKIQEKISATYLPGRIDKLQGQPTVIVDGAINRASAEAFRESVEVMSPSPRILVTALPSDKDYRGVLSELAPVVDAVIITRVSATHLAFNEGVFAYARSLTDNVEEEVIVDIAFAKAKKMAGGEGTIWIVGTQSLVKDALRFWNADVESLMR